MDIVYDYKSGGMYSGQILYGSLDGDYQVASCQRPFGKRSNGSALLQTSYRVEKINRFFIIMMFASICVAIYCTMIYLTY